MKDLINIGKIIGTHHLSGAVKANSLFEDIELLEGKKVILESKAGKTLLLDIESIGRMNEKKLTIKFLGVNNLNSARELLDYKIIVRRDLIPNLGDDEYLIADLLGMEVYEDSGEFVGVVEDILDTAAHEIYVVKNADKEYMIPAVDEFVKELDFDNNKITVSLIEGMLG